MFYQVNLGNREFKSGTLYDDVDWTSLDSVVENYRARVTEWYLNPADHLQRANENFAFPVMALCCIVIDSLSQFFFGTNRSSRGNFIEFVKLHFPEFADKLPTAIQHEDPGRSPRTLANYAEVLYHAFRCGILHDAHVTPYGMVRTGAQVLRFEPDGFTSYAAGGKCATVMIDPWRLLDEVKGVLADYLDRVLDRDTANDVLRIQFKTKFTESFGVDVSGAQ